MQQTLPSRDSILEQLERMLASETFAGAERSRALLRFIVEHAVQNESDRLKEYTIGSEALGRGESFDPRTDPIVRAEASRLRGRLQQYYAINGVADTVLITLPKGSYVPQFEFRAATGGTLTGAGEARPSIRRNRIVWFAIGAVTAGMVMGSVLWVRERARSSPETRSLQFEKQLASGSLFLGSDFGTDLTLSPNGSRIVFVVRDRDGQLRLVSRRVEEEFGESTARDLPGTGGSRLPFSSPNGAWVGFWADGQIKKTAVDGGKPVVLATAADFGGASWVEDDHFIAVVGQSIMRVPASPGPTSVIVNLQSQGVYPNWPDVLPGARHVLITAIGPQGASQIEAVSLADGNRKVLKKGGVFGRYRDGHLLYLNQGTLYAIAFDVDSLSARGTEVPVLPDVSHAQTFGFAQLDIARNGTLVYQRSVAQTPRVLSWIDRAGHVEPFFNRPDSYQFPRLSPEGRRAYVATTDSGVAQAGAIGGSRTTVSVLDPASDRMTRLAAVPGGLSGVWTVDGRFLVIGSMKGLHWARTDDPSRVYSLTEAATIQVPWSFSRDGMHLAYHSLNPPTAFDLWTVRITESAGKLSPGKPELFLRTSSHETYPSFSPDGRWIAYGSGQHGPWEVYVRPFPRTDGGEIKVSDGGGRIPQFINARELVYRTDDHRLMIVPYGEENGAFVRGKPREWTSTRLADTGVINNFDVDPDGTRVLGLLPADMDADRNYRNSITVVLNFSEAVRRRVSEAGISK